MDTWGGGGGGARLGGVEEKRELVPEAGEGAGLRQAQQQPQRVEHAHAAQPCAPPQVQSGYRY